MKNKNLFRTLSLTAGMVLISTQSLALMEGDNWWIGGRVKQGISIATDLEGQGGEVGPSNFIAELQGNYEVSNSIVFSADFWLRGDLYPDIGGSITQRGIQDYTSPGFSQGFGFYLNKPGDGTLPIPFGNNAHEIRFFDNFNDEMIREFSIKYRDPENRVSIKVGKFQRGWGQSDGLRLLDVMHAQDLRTRAVLADADETRIPAWMMAADFNFRQMGIAAPFEAIGLHATSLELIFTPEVYHSQFIINNPTPSDSASGGIFGFPFPVLRDPVSGLGLAFIGANLTERSARQFSVKDAEFGARLKFKALRGEWTINGFYGQQDLPVVKFTGANVIIGSALNDPSAAAAVIPLDVNTAVGAIHGPGGYLDFLRAAAVGAPIAFPLAPFGCTNPLVGAPNCSVTPNFELDYNYRQKLVGASFTRDMTEFKFGPKDVAPVFRVELSYEFDKPFNRSVAMTPFGELATGSGVLTLAPSAVITRRDVQSTMVGFDYFLWIPFWETQRNSIFVSAQFFNIHTYNHENLLQQAPYAFWEVPHNQKFATLLWNTKLINDKLFIEGLTIVDFNNHGLTHRQRIDFNFFGDRIRPRLEWIYFHGRNQAGLLGLFRNSDLIEASVTVQF